MRLTRYRPLINDSFTLPRLGVAPDRLTRIIDEMFNPVVPAESVGWAPAIDIVDHDDELLLTAELPGMKKEDVEIDIADGILTVKGEKKEELEKRQQHYRVVERTYGAFERSFTLPRSVDVEKISAVFEDGVLKVHMPKIEATHGRRVEIKA